MRKTPRIIAAVFIVAFPGLAVFASAAENAVVAVKTVNTGTSGSFGPFSLGFRFRVDHPIEVTALGRFDRDGGGLTNSALARLYNWNTGNALASVTIPARSAGEAAGTYRAHFADLARPVALAPGTVYLIAVEVGDRDYAYDVQTTIGPGINFVDGRATRVHTPAMPATANATNFPIARGNSAASMSYLGADFKYTSSASSLAISAPTSRTIYQRDRDHRAQVPIRGSFSGKATKIAARVVARAGGSDALAPWQQLDTRPDSGTFTGTLTVGAGWYDIQVRSFDDATLVAETRVERIGIGDVFITAGQSNSANHGSPRQTPEDDRVSARISVSVNAWQHAADPQPIATGAGGSPWSRLGDLLVDDSDIPVGFVSVGVGATRVDQWLPGGGHYENRLKAAIRSLGTNGFKAILWHQGESDSLARTSAAVYAQRLKRVIQQSRADAGFAVPWGVALASYHPRSAAANEAQVIAGQKAVIAADPLTFAGAATDDFHTSGYLHDSVHFNRSGLNEHAVRWHAAIAAALPAARARAPQND